MTNKERQKKYRKTHKEEIKERWRIYYKIHKEQFKIYREIHKEQIKKYRDIHKEERKIYDKNYRIMNREKRNIYLKNKLNTDINYRLASRLRVRIIKALKNNWKSVKTIKLLGCSIEQLRKHLEKQFKSGMTWDNYGLWHIDHIRPCVKFDLSKPEEQARCFNYTNLQPLWAEENMKKGRKVKD